MACFYIIVFKGEKKSYLHYNIQDIQQIQVAYQLNRLG